jgi:hypothetical protein
MLIFITWLLVPEECTRWSPDRIRLQLPSRTVRFALDLVTDQHYLLPAHPSREFGSPKANAYIELDVCELGMDCDVFYPPRGCNTCFRSD